VFSCLGDQVLDCWKDRSSNLDSDFAIAAWMLDCSQEVRKDVKERKDGSHHDAMERVIKKLYCRSNEVIAEVIDTFWTEYRHFQNKTGPFNNKLRWQSKDIADGNSHLWLQKYAIPYTKVLGKVGARVTSKLVGIGSAERSWGSVKHLKTDKRAHLGGVNTERQSVLYSTARINEARIKQSVMEKIDAQGSDAVWGDDDVAFDLDLENFGVDTNQYKEDVPSRLFHAWVEDWELEHLKKQCPLSETLLLQKYKNLVFYFPDNKKTYQIAEQNLEFHRGRDGGWCVIGEPLDGDEDDIEPFLIGDMIVELIGDTRQEDHIKVIKKVED